jgi:hypothetical protein
MLRHVGGIAGLSLRCVARRLRHVGGTAGRSLRLVLESTDCLGGATSFELAVGFFFSELIEAFPRKGWEAAQRLILEEVGDPSRLYEHSMWEGLVSVPAVGAAFGFVILSPRFCCGVVHPTLDGENGGERPSSPECHRSSVSAAEDEVLSRPGLA